jgi:hypothetical protein
VSEFRISEDYLLLGTVAHSSTVTALSKATVNRTH